MYRTWEPIDVDTLHCFISLIIYMGVVKAPNVERYWSVNEATVPWPLVSSLYDKVMIQTDFEVVQSEYPGRPREQASQSRTSLQVRQGSMQGHMISKLGPYHESRKRKCNAYNKCCHYYK